MPPPKKRQKEKKERKNVTRFILYFDHDIFVVVSLVEVLLLCRRLFFRLARSLLSVEPVLLLTASVVVVLLCVRPWIVELQRLVKYNRPNYPRLSYTYNPRVIMAPRGRGGKFSKPTRGGRSACPFYRIYI